MIDQYKFLYQGGSGELVEKKSRFIAVTRPVKTEQEAIDFINEMKKKYWDARHHCFAYVLGAKGELCRCSDDGEPSQTAGRPILNVLMGQDIRDACVVVIRYFGGTLLGTGGLVRAYTGAAQEGLENSLVVEKRLAQKLSICSDYNSAGKIQYLLAQAGTAVLDTQYTDQVTIIALVPVGELERMMSAITDGTRANARMERLETRYYGILEDSGEILLFAD